MCVGEQVLKVNSHAHLGLEEVGGAYVLLQYSRYPLMSEFLSGGGGGGGGEGGVWGEEGDGEGEVGQGKGKGI